MKPFVIIPAYNEAENIGEVIKLAKPYASKVIVVDDGSPDLTSEEAKKAGALTFRHITNIGKGAALKTGCDYAVMKGAASLILMDADGQHEADEIPRFVKELKQNDIVFGFRKLDSKMPLVLRAGNVLIRAATKLLFNIKILDTQCGFRALTADAYKKIRWDSIDYSVESEMVAKVGKNHLRFSQIPIATIYQDKYKGTTVVDGVRIVLNMFWWKLTR